MEKGKSFVVLLFATTISDKIQGFFLVFSRFGNLVGTLSSEPHKYTLIFIYLFIHNKMEISDAMQIKGP